MVTTKLNQIDERVASVNWDKVVVSVSGGKDSSVLMAWALRHFPIEKLICVHAKIDIDWKETVPVTESQCEYLGLPLVVVQANHADGSVKGFLSKLVAPRKKRDGTIVENQFPDMSCRWCTSELKVAPIDKFINTMTGNILVLVGERAEESTERANMETYRVDLENSKRKVVKYSPIHSLLETEVWEVINEMGLPVHPVYSWGVSRASCAICIFSSNKEIAIAYERAPEIVNAYMEAESKISHTFRYKKATKKAPEQKLTVREILRAQGYMV